MAPSAGWPEGSLAKGHSSRGLKEWQALCSTGTPTPPPFLSELYRHLLLLGGRGAGEGHRTQQPREIVLSRASERAEHWSCSCSGLPGRPGLEAGDAAGDKGHVAALCLARGSQRRRWPKAETDWSQG